MFRSSNFLNADGTILLIYDTDIKNIFEFSCIIKLKLKKPSEQSLKDYVENFYPDYKHLVKNFEEIKNLISLKVQNFYLEESL